jgi:outer membrane protein OmpA-like peptidoglycan-associated protein
VLEATLADRGDGQSFKTAAPAAARWVRLTVLGNHGDPMWTELMSFRGYGPEIQPPSLGDVSGTYATNYNLFHIRQQGSALLGCYDHDQGLLTGSVKGRVMRLTWQENGGPTDNGPAVMLFAPDGGSFRGVWWHGTDQGKPPGGNWDGTKKSANVGSCPHWKGSVGGEIERALVSEKRARVYGIEFDTNSAALRPESRPVLDEVARALGAHADWNVAIEGHTDAVGADADNLTLSTARARAVLDYLVAQGIAAARLTAAGRGEGQPVADNATSLGRARNRRVELVLR